MKGDDLKWIVLGALGIGAGVLAYKAYKGAKDVADSGKKVLTDAQGAVSDVLTKLFGPALSQAAQESTFFVVKFDENGAQHAVGASTVNAQGQFVYANPPNS